MSAVPGTPILASAAAALTALTGCGAGDAPAPSVGTVQVSVTTAGAGVIPSGYQITVDENRAVAVGANGSVSIANLVPGPHTIRLSGIALHCTSDWYAARSVTVVADSSQNLAYSVVCDAPVTDRVFYVRGGILYSMRTDGTNVAPLGTGIIVDRATVSPGGTRIAYSQVANGRSQVWVMNVDGSGAMQLSDNASDASDPDWSPDGTRLVLTRGATYHMMTADGRADTTLVVGLPAQRSMIRWSPDSIHVGYIDNQRLMVMNVRTRTVTNVRPPNNTDYATALAWAPDGDRIAYVAARQDNSLESDVGVVNANGSGDATILSHTQAATLSMTKDGTRILFDNIVGAVFFDLFSIKTDGSGLANLTNTPTVHEWGPSKTP